ncbi:MAG: hypothetical protein LLG06_05250 [Desulfobacteraceae bacterium]|nr:hypothetical protein [Desulfobacteraceae bacterium]
MERSFAVGALRRISLAVLFAVFLCWGGSIVEAGLETEGNAKQVEAVVIHVDQYAVYAPNLIFYFDTQMDKKKVGMLRGAAERLRNRKALITCSSTGDPGKGGQMVLADIVPAGQKPQVEDTGREAPGPVAEPQGNRRRAPLVEDDPMPREIMPAEPKIPPVRAPAQEERPVRKAELSAPISREEGSAFVRSLLDLNRRKDLAAVETFYADQVDYYDRGVISRDKVIQDLKYYYRNWAEIDTHLDGDVVMIVLDQPEVRIVKFVSSFSVRNDKKAVTGKTETIWKLQRINGKISLIDVKQKMLERASSVI